MPTSEKSATFAGVMETMMQILAAIWPACLLLWIIYRQDKYQPEPKLMLLLGVLMGVVSVVLAHGLIKLSFTFYHTFIGAGHPTPLYAAFCVAAIPEEVAKLLCLWVFLKFNKFFDEYMDGIVYATCIGLGFAGLESAWFLISHPQHWFSSSIMRSLTSVPLHFMIAIMMGYFFALWRFKGRVRFLWMAILAPVFFHGIHNYALKLTHDIHFPQILTIILMLVIFPLLFFLYTRSLKMIAHHLEKDLTTGNVKFKGQSAKTA